MWNCSSNRLMWCWHWEGSTAESCKYCCKESGVKGSALNWLNPMIKNGWTTIISEVNKRTGSGKNLSLQSYSRTWHDFTPLCFTEVLAWLKNVSLANYLWVVSCSTCRSEACLTLSTACGHILCLSPYLPMQQLNLPWRVNLMTQFPAWPCCSVAQQWRVTLRYSQHSHSRDSRIPFSSLASF